MISAEYKINPLTVVEKFCVLNGNDTLKRPTENGINFMQIWGVTMQEELLKNIPSSL